MQRQNQLQLTMHRCTSTRSERRRVRGVGLLDGLIALTILAFGVLGMTRMQVGLIKEITESQDRLDAVRLSEELLSAALADRNNATCYELPAIDACGSEDARTYANNWQNRALAALPGTVAVPVDGEPDTSTKTATVNRTVTTDGLITTETLTVTLTWVGKTANEPRRLTVSTDVSN